MSELITPKKSHFTKFLVKRQAAWLSSKDEVLSEVLKSTIQDVKKFSTFKPWYPTELGLSYGLSKGLIELKGTQVYLTNKGWNEVIKLQQTTCAFTGRRTKGAF